MCTKLIGGEFKNRSLGYYLKIILVVINFTANNFVVHNNTPNKESLPFNLLNVDFRDISKQIRVLLIFGTNAAGLF